MDEERERMRKALEERKVKVAEELNIPEELVHTPYDIGAESARLVRKGYDIFMTFAGTRKSIGKTSAATAALEWFEFFHNENDGLSRTELMLKILEKRFVYTSPETVMLEKVKQFYYQNPQWSGILVDEAKRLAYKRKFASATNIELNLFVAECRKLVDELGVNKGNKLLIFCIDSLYNLDKDTRSAVNSHFEVMARGYAAKWTPDPTPSPDKWYLDFFQKNKFKYLDRMHLKFAALRDIRQQVYLYRAMPGFDGIYIFPNMDFQFELKDETDLGPVEKVYRERDKNAKLEKDKGIENDPAKRVYHRDLALARLIRSYKSMGKTFAEIGREIGLPGSRITDLMKQLSEEERKQAKDNLLKPSPSVTERVI